MLEGSRAEMREVYPASEGFVAIADRGPQQGLRLIADNGLFYEFVPVDELGKPNATRHWLGTVETGVDYAIVLTTCAGLWSYVIGDVVRFVDRAPPRLIITGRTSYMLSSFGEHVSRRADRDLRAGGRRGDRRAGQRVLRRHAVSGERPGELGHHVYVVEFGEAIADPARLAAFAAADRSRARPAQRGLSRSAGSSPTASARRWCTPCRPAPSPHG